MIFNLQKSLNQQIYFPNSYNVELYVKREDTIHPVISGNKYRKLKYNIELAKREGYTSMLTFGGAFSNHIAATAAVGKTLGFKTIGVIRGEELVNKIEANNTLKYAKSCGMKFEFVNRTAFRNKMTSDFLDELKKKYGEFYLVPEGGTNALAIKGCEEILTQADASFDYICVPVGTGGTIAGLINSSNHYQQVLGFSALKGDFLKEDITNFVDKTNWKLVSEYHFGGYAKINSDLIAFINTFKEEYNIALDPVYTGKMMFGIIDKIRKGYFKQGTKILAIHTGGLQGIEGMNLRLKQKKLPLIH